MDTKPITLLSLLVVMCLAALGLSVPAAHATPATWTATGSMTTGRYAHSATLLAGGRVLVAGGHDGTDPIMTAELYDPATGTWAATGDMPAARYAHTATRLPDGKVLVAGGHDGSDYTGTAELYDPATGTWAPTGSMGIHRYLGTATLLPDGKVLVAGGGTASGEDSTATAELYDPATGTWAYTGSMATARHIHTATLLPDGKVLAAGGFDYPITFAGAELYDPTTGTWAATGSMATARAAHTATLLPDGNVLAAGGSPDGALATATATAEIYDPVTETWVDTGSMTGARYIHSATLLPNGKVLAAAGHDGTGPFTFIGTAELYDPVAGTWAPTGSMANPRYFHTATLLPDDNVLAVGGHDGTAPAASAELYEPEPVTAAAAFSVDNVTVNEGDGTATFTVSRDNGVGTSAVDVAALAGGAETPADFSATATTLSFADTETTKSFVVTIVQDALGENNEWYAVKLSNPVGGTLADDTGLGRIIDDDPLPAVSVFDAVTTEGDAGTHNMSFKVQLSAPNGRPVKVTFTTSNGTATAPSDYAFKTVTVRFEPGVTAFWVRVVIKGDTTVEPDQTFKVTLSSPVNGTIGDGVATGRIDNDD